MGKKVKLKGSAGSGKNAPPPVIQQPTVNLRQQSFYPANAPVGGKYNQQAAALLPPMPVAPPAAAQAPVGGGGVAGAGIGPTGGMGGLLGIGSLGGDLNLGGLGMDAGSQPHPVQNDMSLGDVAGGIWGGVKDAASGVGDFVKEHPGWAGVAGTLAGIPMAGLLAQLFSGGSPGGGNLGFGNFGMNMTPGGFNLGNNMGNMGNYGIGGPQGGPSGFANGFGESISPGGFNYGNSFNLGAGNKSSS